MLPNCYKVSASAGIYYTHHLSAAESLSDLPFNILEHISFALNSSLFTSIIKGSLTHPMASEKDTPTLGGGTNLEVPSDKASDTARGLDSSQQPSSQSSEHGDSALAEKGINPVDETSPRDIHGVKWALAVISILISTFLFALDNTIVADVQPAIVERFGQVDKLPWLSVAFLVAASGTNLVW